MADDAAFVEQLNGLMDLLSAVGIDSVDNREVRRASLALKENGNSAPMVFPSDIPESKELNDDQIEAMILKLQQAQAQAPQLMEALKDHAEERQNRSGGGKETKKKKTKNS